MEFGSFKSSSKIKSVYALLQQAPDKSVAFINHPKCR